MREKALISYTAISNCLTAPHLAHEKRNPSLSSQRTVMVIMKHNPKGSRVDGAWLLLILSILGSGLSMLGIGILLVHYHEKPIFDWNGLTLNAIIAVFSAMSKAMLAYALSESLGQSRWIWFSSQQRPLSDIDLIDSGSRGPLGSFQILTQPVARSFISIGAIVVILSITMDPFVQLTVGTMDDVKFENNTNVQISYAKRYSKDLINDSVRGAEVPVADLGMQSAVSDGLSQPASRISQQTPHSCPSGNCTWDTFTSLAICSGCNDLTNRIEKIERTYVHLGRSYTYTDYRLPNNVSGIDETSLMTAYGTRNRNNTVSFTSFDSLLWSMTMLNLTMEEDPPDSGNIWASNFSATECALWFCVNSYQSAVKNGNVTEIIQPAPSKKEIDSWRPFRKGELDTGVVIVSERTSNSFIRNAQDSQTWSMPRRTDLQLGAGFNISQGAFVSIYNLLHNTFVDPRKPHSPKIVMNAFVSRPRRPTSGPILYNPPAMQSLYHSADLAATFATLANSMTNNIRQNSDNHSVLIGQEGKYVVLIRVRGWFLTLPVILIVAGAAFVAVVLHHTHMSGIEFWGTNALPVVALGGKMGPVFDDDDDDDMKVITMERNAKQRLVQFPTIQRRPDDFDRVDDTLNRRENREMISSRSTSVTQIPSTDVERIASPSHTSVTQIPSTAVEGVVSSLDTSFIPRPPADMERVVSSLDTSFIPRPPADMERVVSPIRTSFIPSPPIDTENVVSPLDASFIPSPPADIDVERESYPHHHPHRLSQLHRPT